MDSCEVVAATDCTLILNASDQSEALANGTLSTSLVRGDQCYRGFPARAACISYNSDLRVLAIGTQDGRLRLYAQNRTIQCTDQQISRSSWSLWWMRFLIANSSWLLCVMTDGTMQIWQLTDTSGDDERIILLRVLNCQLENELPLERPKQAICLLESVTLGSYAAFGLVNSKVALVNLDGTVSYLKKFGIFSSLNAIFYLNLFLIGFKVRSE
ncbi:hypothetical protein ACOME3_002907 [Neoechinorhynchus agilis]